MNYKHILLEEKRNFKFVKNQLLIEFTPMFFKTLVYITCLKSNRKTVYNLLDCTPTVLNACYNHLHGDERHLKAV